MKYSNRKYKIETFTNEYPNLISYVIFFNSRKVGYLGISNSLDTVTQYLESISCFSKDKRYGKSAKRWLNKMIKQFLEEKGFDSKILYNSRPIKRIITSLPEQELENRSNYIKNIKQKVLKR